MLREKLVTHDLVPQYISCLSLHIACRKGVPERVGQCDNYKFSILCIVFKVKAFKIAVVPPARVARLARTIHFEPVLVVGFGTECQIGS